MNEKESNYFQKFNRQINIILLIYTINLLFMHAVARVHDMKN